MTLAFCAQSSHQRPDCGQHRRPHSGACRCGCEPVFQVLKRMYLPNFLPASRHIVNPQFKGHERKTCVILKHFDLAISSWLFLKATCIWSVMLFGVRELVGIAFQIKERRPVPDRKHSTLQPGQGYISWLGTVPVPRPPVLFPHGLLWFFSCLFFSNSFCALKMALPWSWWSC